LSTTIFQYPKSKHVRSLAPRIFKRYQTYKRYLQHEFSRTCVYCRQPDSSAPNLNFGVDHYRPKGIPRFAALVCDYKNLFYCCGSCNSRKNNDWPLNEKIGPYIVNPCDHVMSQHLKFEAASGKVLTGSDFGEYTEDLLQLNDPTLVEFRKASLHVLKLTEKELVSLKNMQVQLTAHLQQGKISSTDYDLEINEIMDQIKSLETIMQNHIGAKPPLSLRKTRLGVTLSLS
jgi:hypothetical protein